MRGRELSPIVSEDEEGRAMTDPYGNPVHPIS